MGYGRSLLRLGITLFLIGLLTGLVVQEMKNPRAGLAAHLEGVMNGMFLMIAGLAWKELGLSGRAERLTYVLLLFGTFANWATTTAIGVLGTSRATPIAGAGHSADPIAENAVFTMLLLLAGSMIVACTLMAYRLWRPATGRSTSDASR
jgi:hydroxylaminobenzene mutase